MLASVPLGQGRNNRWLIPEDDYGPLGHSLFVFGKEPSGGALCAGLLNGVLFKWYAESARFVHALEHNLGTPSPEMEGGGGCGGCFYKIFPERFS